MSETETERIRGDESVTKEMDANSETWREKVKEKLGCHLCYHTSQPLTTDQTDTLLRVTVLHSKAQLASQNRSTALVSSQAQLKQNSSEVLFSIHQCEPPPQLIKTVC